MEAYILFIQKHITCVILMFLV